jgi:MGT family glycosyltransferase
MARFLFCSLNSPGYLLPAIRIADTLRREGHRVAFATDVACAERLVSADLERIPRGSKDGPSFKVGEWSNPIAIAIQLKHVEHAIAAWQPDVLVGQPLTFGAFLARERHRLPIAVMDFSTYLWPLASSGDAPTSSERERRAKWRYIEFVRTYNEARGLIGLPAWQSPNGVNPFLGDLCLLRTVEELEGDIEALPTQVHCIGACLVEEDAADPEVEEWLAHVPGDRLIYVHHGKFFDVPTFWPHLMRACTRLNIHAVASVDRMDRTVLDEPPPNVLVRPYVSQSRVLSRAAGMVATANSTAVLGAITAGVPSLLIPAGGEQPDVAERCHSAGVARVILPFDLTADALECALEQVLDDPAMRDATARLGAAFHRIDSFSMAAGLLGVLASTGRPVVRGSASWQRSNCLV